MLNHETLRLLICRKLQDGRLPHGGVTRVWSSPSDGERCDACGEILSKEQLLMEGTTQGRRQLQFHVQCFRLWDDETRTQRSRTA
jgi:hypothetical protein